MRIKLPFLAPIEIRRSSSTEVAYPAESHYGHLMAGGIVNPSSGMGIPGVDKSESSFFVPTRIHWHGQLEVLRVQSWAARHFIEMPIDDMFVLWREWDKEAGALKEAMEEAEARHMVQDRLAMAMKAGRLYGTSLLVIITKEDDLMTPLDIDRIRPGDLVSLQPFHRYDCNVWERDEYDATSPTYRQPISYQINPTAGGGFYVHHSRVLRFDGIVPLTADGFRIYDRDWGVSEIVSAILAILQDQTVATSAAHLSQEASIFALKVDGLREALAGGPRDPNEPSAEQIGQQINRLKSVYRLLMMDKTEDVERIAVEWNGLHEIMDRFNKRLSGAAGIPSTRFWGQSPIGFNATGESDMVNYAISVGAKQKKMLTQPLRTLDMILARDSGIAEPPDFAWRPLIQMSEAEQAEIALKKVEAAEKAVTSGLIEENEGRAMLNGDPLFGELEGEAPGIQMPILGPAPLGGPGNDGGGK